MTFGEETRTKQLKQLPNEVWAKIIDYNLCGFDLKSRATLESMVALSSVSRSFRSLIQSCSKYWKYLLFKRKYIAEPIAGISLSETRWFKAQNLPGILKGERLEPIFRSIVTSFSSYARESVQVIRFILCPMVSNTTVIFLLQSIPNLTSLYLTECPNLNVLDLNNELEDFFEDMTGSSVFRKEPNGLDDKENAFLKLNAFEISYCGARFFTSESDYRKFWQVWEHNDDLLKLAQDLDYFVYIMRVNSIAEYLPHSARRATMKSLICNLFATATSATNHFMRIFATPALRPCIQHVGSV